MRHEAAAVWQDDPREGELLPVFKCCIVSMTTYSGASFPTEEQARAWALLEPGEGNAAGEAVALQKWINEGRIPVEVLGDDS